MVIIILLVLVIVASLITVTVYRVTGMEWYLDATTGETWTPRYLIVMYRDSAHRDEQGRLGPTDGEITDDEKHRAIWWGHILLTAQAYCIPFEDIPTFGKQYSCNCCRVFDLKTARKSRREVLYAMSSMLVDQCRDAGVAACARIIGERDSRPFNIGRFSQFFENDNDFVKFADGVYVVLSHANIPKLADSDTVLHRLLQREISPNEMLDGARWFASGANQAA